MLNLEKQETLRTFQVKRDIKLNQEECDFKTLRELNLIEVGVIGQM